MSIDVTGLSDVLSRIASIESMVATAAPQLPTSPVSTSSTGTSAAFNSALAQYSANPAAGYGTTALGSTALGSTALGSTGYGATPTSATALDATGLNLAGLSDASAAPVTGNDVVTSAEKYLGVPYVFGGTSDSGLDCSGLVQKAYGDLGISLPRLSWDQAKTGTAVPSLAQAQPGDILGFGNPAHHVAIYLGNNQMIAAPQTGENVKIQNVYETPSTIRRIIGSTTDSGAVTDSTAATPTSGISPAVQQYSSLFSQAESQYNLPSGLLAAVAQTESGGDPSAVSSAGAQGLMQLMPTTAAGLGVNPLDPAQAINGSAQLLSSYLTKYQSVPLALAAYNAGPGAVDAYGGVPPYAQTQNYVNKITAIMAGGTT